MTSRTFHRSLGDVLKKTSQQISKKKGYVVPGGNSNTFFHPRKFGETIQLDGSHIFQMGGESHQLIW